MKIMMGKTECCLDDNKQVCIEDENCYACCIKKNSTNINSIIENNTATVCDESLECGDLVDVWYYSLLQ